VSLQPPVLLSQLRVKLTPSSPAGLSEHAYGVDETPKQFLEIDGVPQSPFSRSPYRSCHLVTQIIVAIARTA